MTLRTLTLVALAALLAPAAARAQWGDDDRGEDNGGRYYDDGYDVSSYDLDTSGSVSLSTFQAPLGPYGDWVTAGGYGTVWRPRVALGWRPYYYGRWEWTNEGWLWVSDEPFGWATYHYGRWTWDRGLGWFWVPGYQWAPAWVSWRYSGDVVGWAPLAPGLSLYVTDFAFVDFWWTFVPTVRFCGTPVYGVAYAPGFSRRWFDATRPAPPRPAPAGGFRPGMERPAQPAWGGPSSRFVEERAGRPVRPVRIVPTPSPADRGAVRPGEIGIFRPEARPRPERGGRFDGRGDSRPASPGFRGDERPGRGPGMAPSPGRGPEGVPPGDRGRGERPGMDRGRGFAPDRGVERAPDRGFAPDRGNRASERAPDRGFERAPDRGFERGGDRGFGQPERGAPAFTPPPRGAAPSFQQPERSAPPPSFSPPAHPSAPPAAPPPSRGSSGGESRPPAPRGGHERR
jgi:hypothetical protein